MSTRLFVGNLGFRVTDEELQELFRQAGEVVSAEVVRKPMGYGFVEMKTPEEAQKAIEILKNKQFQGRTLNVDYAKVKSKEPAQAPEPVAQAVQQPQVSPAQTTQPATSGEVMVSEDSK